MTERLNTLVRKWILLNGPASLHTPDPKLDTLHGPGEASSKLITSTLGSSHLGKRRQTHPSRDNLRGKLGQTRKPLWKKMPGPEQPLEQGWLHSPEAPTNELHTPGTPGQGAERSPLPGEVGLGCAWESEAEETTEAALGAPCVQGCGRSSSKQGLGPCSPDSPRAQLNPDGEMGTAVWKTEEGDWEGEVGGGS